MDVDERSSIRIIKRGPCLPALLLVLKARGSLAVFPQNWLASSFVDNERGTVGKADLKQQHCDWNSGASFLFVYFLSHPQTVWCFLAHFISPRRQVKIHPKENNALFLRLHALSQECCFTDSSDLWSLWLTESSSGARPSVSSTYWNTTICSGVTSWGGKLMRRPSTPQHNSTTAQQHKDQRPWNALISVVWDAPGCHSASPSCSWRIMVMQVWVGFV